METFWKTKIPLKPLEIEGWTIVLRHLHPNASGKIQSIKTLQLSILSQTFDISVNDNNNYNDYNDYNNYNDYNDYNDYIDYNNYNGYINRMTE